jgi:hypothetical protein
MRTADWSPWEESDVLKGSKNFLVHIAGNGCKCEGWVDEYVWEPAGCVLAAWDAAAFCDALGARSLMFIGDSTMIQVFLMSEVPL